LRGCIALVLLMAAQAGVAGLEQQRKLYRAADQAARKYDWDQLQLLRPQLDEYPLALYLDYARMQSRLRHVDGVEAVQFMQASSDTPLQLRFKDRYLRRAGRDRRWVDFLAVSAQPPKTVDLQCYYYRARRAEGALEEAWEGARRLWVYGKSRPKACDPLFKKWIDAGQLNDELVWQRMLLAFDAYRGSLLAFVGKQGSQALQPRAELLKSVYHYPAKLSKTSLLPVDEDWSLQVLSHGLPRLASRDLSGAMRLWQKVETRYPFTDEQRHKIGDALAHRIMLRKKARWESWLDNYLVQRGDDKLLERRLRWVLREGEWVIVAGLVAALSPSQRREPEWRYWFAHSLEETGEASRAREILEALAMERDFYGFAAAQLLGRPFDLNHEPLSVTGMPEPGVLAENFPGLQRTEELLYHEQPMRAQSEWAYLLKGLEPAEQEYLAWHARQQQWYRFAIDAATEAQAWNRLELRYPLAYPESFKQFAQLYNVADSELMSIARRESAFFPRAASPVGARGLMQLMPRTAKQVARQLKEPQLTANLFDVEANITLGGAYYRQLKDSYKGNRVLTLAAYNAGPHRVRAWRSKNGEQVSVLQWVESIPFRETREYVKNVLTYNVVYQNLNGQDTDLFNAVELNSSY
jgi:soluble lytic murein transglycosylase